MPISIISLSEKSQWNAGTLLKLVSKGFRWRWISILLLGVLTNFVINAVLDYKYQRAPVSFSLEEYMNAIIASIILLEGMRHITHKLDDRFPWSEGVKKRIGIQFCLHLIFIVVTLNILLISITWLFYGGFYSVSDLIVINASVVSLVFFFSIIDTGIYFFTKWKRSTIYPESESESSKPIQVSLGRLKYLVNQRNIKYAVSRSGLVLVRTEEKQFPYSASLDTLMTSLDQDQFFRANRQMILHHSVVKSMKPLDYGKLQVEFTSEDEKCETTVISRTRAAAFRQWLKSNYS